MRLRNIRGSKETIATSDYVVQEPETHKGTWGQLFGNEQPVQIEVGMGKGRFIMDMARLHPDRNFVGIEMYDSVLLRAVQKREQLEEDLPNLYFIRMDARNLPDVFEKGEVDKIYLNFSDPWPKERHAKRRLTHRDFLLRYRQVLRDGGEIHFKTDNVGLFAFSVTEFPFGGFTPTQVTHDLHKDGICGIMTDYEEKFHNQGTKINRCVAVKTELPPQPAAPEQPDGAEENDAPDQEA